ncbi:response regulator [Trinickia terrae]|uniref:histidine kinase n=1 Tax=Trinickia terrae TaxID=2571161 RepID=A0A4V5PK32_9BURK|nr:hybrid sensor histidine kinase/response regulator [Trinickia terrae]TKC88370.1 response regulator [Trinickia terrae]
MTPHRPDEPHASQPAPNWQEESPYPAVPEPDFAVRRITLIALLIAAIVLPCVYVAASAYASFRARVAEATDITLRTVRIGEEHALKVFDLNETLDARIDDFVRGLSNDAVRAQEATIHEKLNTIGGGYPQVASVSIFGPDGMLLANSRYYPAPHASIADRDDFTGIRDGKVIEHVSKVMIGRVGAGETVFNSGIARRNADGSFGGLVSVALRQSYFDAFYRELLGSEASAVTMTLMREDGAVLASFPLLPAAQRQPAPRPELASALAAARRDGVLHTRDDGASANGGAEIIAYRRVGSYPVYVSCAYREAALRADWYRHLAVLMVSVFTPSIVLWLMIGLSLKRLAAEEQAWARWQAEASMRRSIESAYRQSRKMEALGNLVGSVAHDFNNLLMIVSANVQIARRRGNRPAEGELSAIERALKGGQSLTRQLLGVARKQPLRSETIEFARWMDASRELLRASLGAKVELVIEVRADVWPIHVDVAELELALINIAVNARDAMPNGGRFTVRAGNVSLRHGDGFPLTGDFVQISLDDTGSGMGRDVLAHAFEPLFTTKPKGMGTGLGLPQVFAFCERSGGLATIDSAIGAGTSVRLYLPRSNAVAAAAPAAEPRREEPAVSGGLNILLVEDNDEVAAGTEALLQMMGHTVHYVFNADAALRLVEHPAAPFDLVISDIHMPGAMNGIDLAEAIEALPAPVPVILVTGYAEELERARNVKARVLSKPFDIALLEKILQTIRREREQRAQPAGKPG